MGLKKNLSVLIVNYNTRYMLLDCLKSIRETAGDVSIETWVVDNASSDGSAEAVEAKYPGIYISNNDINKGFAGANNQLIPKVSGDILILLNPDTIVLPGAIQALEQVFRTHTDVGIVGPQLLNPDGTLQPSHGKFASLWSEFLFQTFLFKVVSSPFPLGRVVSPLQVKAYSRPHRTDWVTGACLAIRRDVVDKIGLLDEGYFMYGEDMDWCWRARQAGFTVLYEPEAKVIHHSRQASRQDYRTWIKRYTSGQLRFIKKNRSQSYYSIFGLLVYFGSFLRTILWMGVMPTLPQRRVEAHQRVRGYLEAMHLGWQALMRRLP
jgi:N-acetylglucosaminyl-diphospho-decaprenol L-rhamnosyltransferase